MATSNFAMGAVLFLAGATAYSLDSRLIRRRPALAERRWFQWLGSAPWPVERTRRWSLIAIVATVLFSVLTYDHFRGAVLTPYHSGPVSPAAHHISLSHGEVRADGRVRFTAYLDAGTPAEPANLIDAALIGPQGRSIEHWSGRTLAALPADAVANEYAYNRFAAGYAGLTARMGARAILTLPPARPGLTLPRGTYVLVLHSVNGHSFRLEIPPGPRR